MAAALDAAGGFVCAQAGEGASMRATATPSKANIELGMSLASTSFTGPRDVASPVLHFNAAPQLSSSATHTCIEPGMRLAQR